MAWPDFSMRATTVELMDSEATTLDDYRVCLSDLERVNRATRAYRPTLAFLGRLAAAGRLPAGRPLRIADAGSGYGDMLRRIAEWARRRSIKVNLIGIDLNPRAAHAAAGATPQGLNISWVTGDIFDFVDPGGIDLVISSLVAHHLDGEGPVRLIDWMERTAGIGWIINDLHRHPLPYAVFSAWARLAGWHRLVVHDGPISVTRAFTSSDWRRYLRASRVPEGAADIRWWMPFRICVSRVKTP